MQVGLPLSGNVVWITGANSGIGRALAREFAALGATLALSGRRKEPLESVSAEIAGEVLALPCDVCDEQQQQDAIGAIVKRFGGLDVAVANAGFSVGGRVEELTAADWRRQFDTNVVGAAVTAAVSLPELTKRRGRVALVGSASAFFPAPGFAAYHASKYAVRALGRTLSAELAGSGVSCTTVHPGFVVSEINRVDNFGRHDPTRQESRPRQLLWPTDKAARVICAAIRSRRRELVFTGHGKVASWLGMNFPSLAHFVMTRPSMLRQAGEFQVADDHTP